MKELEQKYIDSREVAEMVGKDHSKLLRDIRVYSQQLNESKIGLVEFFTESSYVDGKGETRPCYNVTKKGCEFIAHKLTGIKGSEFTAKYINRFHEMEDVIQTQLPTGSDLIALAVIEAHKMLEQKDLQIKTLKQEAVEMNSVIEESKPKVEYFDAVLSSDGLLNITQIAKEFGKTAVEMNKLLHDLGIQYKAGSCWVPRQNYVDKGYMKSCTRMVAGKTTVQYRWTQKGREFIHRLMARYGYSPVYSGDAITA